MSGPAEGLGSEQDLTEGQGEENQGQQSTDPNSQANTDTEHVQEPSADDKHFEDKDEPDSGEVPSEPNEPDDLHTEPEVVQEDDFKPESSEETEKSLTNQEEALRDIEIPNEENIPDTVDTGVQEVIESFTQEKVETYEADITEDDKLSDKESVSEKEEFTQVSEPEIQEEVFVTKIEFTVKDPSNRNILSEYESDVDQFSNGVSVDPVDIVSEDVRVNDASDEYVTPEVNKSDVEILQEPASDLSETARVFDQESEDLNTSEISEKLETSLEMPGKREEEVLSPTLQSATCRYRWAKTVRTNSQDILFFPSYKMEEPIKLTWSESTECYFSDEMTVATGVYKGNLVIDGNTYPIEDIAIKHYTFEADIYVKEDILDSEGENNLITEDNEEKIQQLSIDDLDTERDIGTDPVEYKKMEDPSDIGIHVSSKYEELVKKQMSDTYVSNENELNRSLRSEKSDRGSTGRRTPIGDVATETFQDGGDGMYLSGSVKDQSFTRDSLNNSIVEDEVERPRSRLSNLGSGPGSARQTPQLPLDDIYPMDGRDSIRSPHSSARQTPQKEVVSDLLDTETQRTPQRLEERSLNGSGIYSPKFGNEDASADILRSPIGSVHSSARQTPVRESVDDVLGSDTRRSPARSLDGTARLTPQGNFVDDVLGQSTPKSLSEHGSEHGTPLNRSTHSSARHTPQLISDSFKAGQEKLYNYPGSGDSRPQSVTSEQELTHYLESGGRYGSLHGSIHGSEKSNSSRTPTNVTSPAVERAPSASSLPVLTTQQRLQQERQSMTPDNLIRVPDSTSPALRGTPVANRSQASSRASNRTITPTSAANIQENGYTDSLQVQRIQDLEDSVRNLRKLLSSRETEVHELTRELRHLNEQNASLTSELERAKKNRESVSNSSIAELEKKYKSMISEKEILAAEVVKLRDQIDGLQKGRNRNGEPDGGSGGEISHGISSYDPNNPYVLQRRISDLQSQVQDLQEANECAVAELSIAEKKLEQLKQENESLRTVRSVGHDDLQEENKRLQDQITRLYEQGYGGAGRKEDEHQIKIETQQLKDDNRALRERNYKLHEENVKLRGDMLTRTSEHDRQPKMAISTESRLSSTRGSSLDHTTRHIGITERLPHDDDTALSATRGLVEKPLLSSSRFTTEKPMTLSGRVTTDKATMYTTRTSLERSTTPSSRMHFEMDDNRFTRSLDRKSDSRFRSSLEKDSSEVLKSSLDRDRDTKYRRSTDREESHFRNSIDKAESRLRSSIERADAKFRNDIDREDTRYRREESTYPRFSTGKSVSDRSLERKSYNSDEMDKLRTETLRTVPDGVDDKEISSSNIPRIGRSMTPDRLSYNTIGLDSERSRYGKGRVSSSDRDVKTLSGSYTSLEKPTFSDKRREWSRSEADLYSARLRERARTPERHYNSGPGPTAASLTSMPVFTGQHAPTLSQYESPSARLPKPKFKWDDEMTSRRRPVSTERGENPDMLTGLSGANYAKTTPARMSNYRSRDLYERDNDKGYEYSRKLPTSSSYQEDSGELSDTATDILVNAQPYEKQDPLSRLSPDSDRYHQRHSSQNYNFRKRRDSLGSEGSLSDVDDIDAQLYTSGKHLRSKSADGRELSRRSQPLGSTERTGATILMKSADRTLYKTLPAPPTANFRTVVPPVLTTQHNRNMLSASTGSFSSVTAGLRPFAPRTPGDMQLDDVVKFSRQGGKLSQGIVKFVGHLPGRSDAYLGVELDKEDGKHDGKFEGMRYFRCKPNKGVFVAFNKVVMAWTP